MSAGVLQLLLALRQGVIAYLASIAEAGSASDATSAVLNTNASISEAGNATDSVGVSIAGVASLTESGAATDAVSASVASSQSVAEAGSASDAVSVVKGFVAAVAEAGSAADAVSAVFARAATTWDAATEGPHCALSSGNLLATYSGVGDSNNGNVRGTQSNQTGKRQFEVTIQSGGAVQLVGVCDSSNSNSTLPGFNAHSWAYYGNNGNKYTNSTGASMGVSFTNGDVIDVVVDATGASTTVSWYKNNALQGSFTGLALTGLYPQWGPGTDTGSFSATLNCGATAFTNPIAGCTAWDA